MKWLIAAAVLWWICCRDKNEANGAAGAAAGTSASGLLPFSAENRGPLSFGAGGELLGGECSGPRGSCPPAPVPPGTLDQFAALGRAEGRQATAITRRAIYGTRLYAPLQADRASSQLSAIGIGPSNVLGGGPRFSAEPGAPVCRLAMR